MPVKSTTRSTLGSLGKSASIVSQRDYGEYRQENLQAVEERSASEVRIRVCHPVSRAVVVRVGQEIFTKFNNELARFQAKTRRS